MPPRTIDNLGIEVSTRYAEDLRELDQKLLVEARGIQEQTEIEITHPFFLTELEVLLEPQKQQTWATFTPPKGYFEQKKRFFMFQLIPSLGSEEKHETQTQKILSLKTFSRKKRGNQQRQQEQESNRSDPEKEYHEKEKKILVSVLQTIMHLDKEIQEINARRGQYHKG
ncbi:Family of unknown function (DUF5399) [Candidatus Rhabdochlamydia oedothoracis]|uniref:Uncharacterized protein n=1 Tax=Candidatus Rhabdochlamydia oedothoracis TaxID=2720720 RepID=A0ABX8V1T6_9BACT|nr:MULTISPECIES: DUF5399 family protein [Rhabdochlamydia]KAG6559351.1 hypothetical protein RHOW815_000651 [Candidatus Rhabdochlamydia sp. W815]MCL6755917.1 DUF5399 family protein [Candidatus Rhabdochlamydia oedothoracis]QYF49200.1 Family of unknown function (DUF5399) [Candidatus Rhabdochlamydia oedothoracis]